MYCKKPLGRPRMRPVVTKASLPAILATLPKPLATRSEDSEQHPTSLKGTAAVPRARVRPVAAPVPAPMRPVVNVFLPKRQTAPRAGHHEQQLQDSSSHSSILA